MTKNIAHRGFSKIYPENTMMAFRKAIEAGCDGIELDVQLTLDCVPVIIHDENIKRTTGRSGLVRDFTAESLQSFDASNGFDSAFGINPIPTLREYFEYVKDINILTNIELKNSLYRYDGMEEIVIGMIREYGIADKIIFSSFNHYSMLSCKKLAPEIKCAFLTSCWQIEAGSYAKQNGIDFINPKYTFLTDINLLELMKHNIDVFAWTVDDENNMKRLIDQNVFAIITNCPDRLNKLLKNN